MMTQLEPFQQPAAELEKSGPDNYRPKAFYSATNKEGSLYRCWRCDETVERELLAEHTRRCWPEVGR